MKNFKILFIVSLVVIFSSCGSALETAQKIAEEYQNANSNNFDQRNPDRNNSNQPDMSENDGIENNDHPLAILNFRVDESEFIEGQTLTLSWEVVGASEIIIQSSDYSVFMQVGNTGELEINPLTSLVYTLKATNFIKVISQSLEVDLIEEPLRDNVAIDIDEPHQDTVHDGQGGITNPEIPQVGEIEEDGLSGDDNLPIIPDGEIDQEITGSENDQPSANPDLGADDLVDGAPMIPQTRRDPVDFGQGRNNSMPIINVGNDFEIIDYQSHCDDIDDQRLSRAIRVDLAHDFIIAGESTTIGWNTVDILDPLPTISIISPENNRYASTALANEVNLAPRVSTTYEVVIDYCQGKNTIIRRFDVSVGSWREREIFLPNHLTLSKIIPTPNQGRGFYISTFHYLGDILRPVVYEVADLLNINSWGNPIRVEGFSHEFLDDEQGQRRSFQFQHQPFSAVLKNPLGCHETSFYAYEGFVYRTIDGQPVGPVPSRDNNHTGNDDRGTIIQHGFDGRYTTPEFIFEDPYHPGVIYIGGQENRMYRINDCSELNIAHVIDDNAEIFNGYRATAYALLDDEIVILSGGRLIRGRIDLQGQRIWNQIDRIHSDYQWVHSGSNYILAGRENGLFILSINNGNLSMRTIQVPNLNQAIQFTYTNLSGQSQPVIIGLFNDGSIKLTKNFGVSWNHLRLPRGFGEITDLYQGSALNKIWLFSSYEVGLELNFNN